jgi:hypothetical protein
MPNYDFSSIPKSASSALYGLREPEPQTSKAQTTRIYPIPDLPKSASSALYFLRKSEEARAIRSSQPIVDFTAQEQLPVNNAASAFFKDFEYFNARALSTILRNDMVNGQNIKYSPITNLSSINITYNPNNLVALQSTLQSYFDAFEINLDKYIPIAEEPTEEYTATETSAEYEVSIAFADVIGNERVEVEFLVMDTAFNDTMYT